MVDQDALSRQSKELCQQVIKHIKGNGGVSAEFHQYTPSDETKYLCALQKLVDDAERLGVEVVL